MNLPPCFTYRDLGAGITTEIIMKIILFTLSLAVLIIAFDAIQNLEIYMMDGYLIFIMGICLGASVLIASYLTITEK